MKKKSLKEIAQIAQVSIATVSLVWNAKTGVGAEKREKIRQLLSENGYVIKVDKKILFLKYRFHGTVIDENQGFISAVFESVKEDLRTQGYQITTIICENPLREQLESIDYKLYCGAVVLGTELQPDNYRLLDLISIPFIVLDNNMDGYICSTVSIDNDECVREALSICNFREVAYLQSSCSTANFQERKQAVNRIALEKNLSVQRFQITPTLQNAYESVRQMSLRLPPFIIADNDIIALGAIKALQENGYRIPEDCAVVGFDDIPISEISVPPLSTIRIPRQLFRQQAVVQLLGCMTDKNYRYLKTRITGILISRESTRIC